MWFSTKLTNRGRELFDEKYWRSIRHSSYKSFMFYIINIVIVSYFTSIVDSHITCNSYYRWILYDTNEWGVLYNYIDTRVSQTY